MQCFAASLCVLSLVLATVSGQTTNPPPPGTYNTITTTSDCNGHQTVTYANIPSNGPGITRNNNNNCNGPTPADNSFANAMAATTNTNNNMNSGSTITNNNMNSGGTITNNNGAAGAPASPTLVRNANGLLVPASALPASTFASLAPAPGPGAGAAGVIPPGTADAAQAAPAAAGATGSTITNNNGVAAPGTVNNNNNGPVPAGATVNNNMNGAAASTVNNNNNGGAAAGGVVNNNNNGAAAATGVPGAPVPPPGTYNTITTITDCVTGTQVQYTYVPANGPGITRNNQNTCNSPGSSTITNNNG